MHACKAGDEVLRLSCDVIQTVEIVRVVCHFVVGLWLFNGVGCLKLLVVSKLIKNLNI